MFYAFNGMRPVVHPSAFVHPQANVTGDVWIGRDVYIGPGAVLRGDWGRITVGDGANDLPMLAIAGLGVAFRAKPLVKQSAKQAISTLGLDGVLYLLGFRDRDGQL